MTHMLHEHGLLYEWHNLGITRLDMNMTCLLAWTQDIHYIYMLVYERNGCYMTPQGPVLLPDTTLQYSLLHQLWVDHDNMYL